MRSGVGALCARGRAGVFFLVLFLAGADCFVGDADFVCGNAAEREKGAVPARSAAPNKTTTFDCVLRVRTAYCEFGTTPERNIVKKRSPPLLRSTLNMTLCPGFSLPTARRYSARPVTGSRFTSTMMSRD